MNQYLTSNHYRRFPFVQDATLPFDDAVFADVQIAIVKDFEVFDGGACRLTKLVRGAGTTALEFTIVSTPMSGFKLTGTSADTDDDTRITLTLVDASDVQRPELGYGYCVIGNPASMAALPGTTTMSADLDTAAIRALTFNQPLSIFVGNTTRSGPSTCDETPGATHTLQIQNRSAALVEGCVETTTAPDTLQVSVDSVTGVSSEIAIVPPVELFSQISNTTITTITTTDATINDAVPALPTGYDAIVEGGAACAADCVVDAGHNVDLSGSFVDNILQFNYTLGGGIGVDCDEVLGYEDLGTLSSQCIKAINGTHTQTGEFTLTGGAGVSLVPDPAGHRILILMNAPDQSRAAP